MNVYEVCGLNVWNLRRYKLNPRQTKRPEALSFPSLMWLWMYTYKAMICKHLITMTDACITFETQSTFCCGRKRRKTKLISQVKYPRVLVFCSSFTIVVFTNLCSHHNCHLHNLPHPDTPSPFKHELPSFHLYNLWHTTFYFPSSRNVTALNNLYKTNHIVSGWLTFLNALCEFTKDPGSSILHCVSKVLPLHSDSLCWHVTFYLLFLSLTGLWKRGGWRERARETETQTQKEIERHRNTKRDWDKERHYI